ncbi:MAG: acetyl-CoA carboxylase biotin carboxyl carrier protein [Flavobacteriales bacterium]
MDIKDIQHLIKFVAKSGAHEVKLEMEDIKITIKTGPDQTFNENSGMVQQVQPMPVLAQAPEVVAAPVQSEEDNLITIKSPIIGTFYRKATPEKPSFVEIGQVIKEGDVLCVIEAMKLFNEIESELSGTIVKILADDASPVEFDQPLFVINPS